MDGGIYTLHRFGCARISSACFEMCIRDRSRVNSYLDTVSRLNPTDYVTYNATDEELRDCGLDKPELTVSVDYIPQTENTGQAEKKNEETFILKMCIRDSNDLYRSRHSCGYRSLRDAD